MRKLLSLLAGKRLTYDRLTAIVLGLGNPGPEYQLTRHNVGFLVLDQLARRRKLAFLPGRGPFSGTRLRCRGGWALLAKPSTWMNLSGEAAVKIADLSGLGPKDILVIVDDMDLPFGRIRLRPSGGAGGHRGLESVTASLGDDGFARLRVGIGRPADDAADHVLEPFTDEEQTRLPALLDAAADAVDAFLNEGLNRAMNRFNSLEVE